MIRAGRGRRTIGAVRAVVLVPLLASACLRSTSHQCASAAECGPTGTCEPNGACSFPADACDSGRRYGDGAGPLAGECVAVGDPDAGAADAPPPDAAGTWDYGDGHHGALVVIQDQARINGYGGVLAPAPAGSAMIDVKLQDNATVGTWGGRFEIGDRVIVWQTTGLAGAIMSGAPDPVTLDDGVARWHETRVVSYENDRLEIADPLPFAITTDAQVVHVPELTTVTVGTGRELVPQSWNGDYGGIIAFYAEDLVLTDARVEGAGRGFRGGFAEANLTTYTGCIDLDGRAANGGGSRKGESFAPARYATTGASSGRGNILHGGGGGNCHNAGGAGGGHGGAGGRGGHDEMARAVGGMPGAALRYSPLRHLVMGGGGGAGERNDGSNSDGADGGAVVFVTARNISCSGNGAIDSDGSNAASASNDGAGGGGAGGMVWIRAETITNCTVGADGGNGGARALLFQGSGGGGAGGTVWILQNAPTGADLDTSAGPGARGAGSSMNGAADGQYGAVCGDGTLQPGETCDDGNYTAGDACTYCRE